MIVGNLQTLSSDTPVFRKDLENQVYARWQEEPTNQVLMDELRRLLLHHAQAVMYSILRRSDTALAAEAADKVMLNLEHFQGDSLFTTWAHSIITRTMYYQRRQGRRRKEVSIEKAELLGGELSLGVVDIIQTAKKVLDSEQFAVFEEKVLRGRTFDEIEDALSLPHSTVHRQWTRIVSTLRDALA